MSSNGRSISSTYWNSKNAVPIVIAPFETSTELTIKDSTVPATTEPWTPHHIPRNADSRRTEVPSVSALSSTKRHIA